MAIHWVERNVAPRCRALLRELAGEYPIVEDEGSPSLEIAELAERERLRVTKNGDHWGIECGIAASPGRGVAFALAGMETDEWAPFPDFGILLDCSRTGVVNVEHFKRWLRRLALFGYNTAMLYTKDAYQLPYEPYFGHMRGAYSLEELREIDDCADRLGIEMVASFQALGHLEPILRWGAYGRVRDTDDCILADHEDSYRLITKMIEFWGQAFRSRRLHLGMDETHTLGRGRFLDHNGYEPPFHIYNRHLARVTEICGRLGLEPMIWSDMYFRLGNRNLDYYDPATVVPEEVRAAIPEAARLWYWDYYHEDAAFYTDWIRRHRELGKEPLMASGLWTWSRLWYDHEKSTRTAGPCIDACRAAGIREILFTLWGDDGGYCEFDSVFAGLAWAADYSNNEKADEERIARLFQAVTGATWQVQLLPGAIEEYHYQPNWQISAPALLWDDPLMGIARHEYRQRGDALVKYLEKLSPLAGALQPHLDETGGGDLRHAYNIIIVLEKKIRFRFELESAYRGRDEAALRRLPGKVDPILAAVEALKESFRAQYLRSNKSWGLEIMQIRLSGLQERYREVRRRIAGVLDGTQPVIEELEIQPETTGWVDSRYRMLATGGWFI